MAAHVDLLARVEAAWGKYSPEYEVLAELIEAASAYFNGYCQDEASEDGLEFTGCTQEQHEAANRLHTAIAKATQP